MSFVLGSCDHDFLRGLGNSLVIDTSVGVHLVEVIRDNGVSSRITLKNLLISRPE